METKMKETIVQWGREAFANADETWDQPPEIGMLVLNDGHYHPIQLGVPSEWWGLFPETYDGIMALALQLTSGGPESFPINNPNRIVGVILMGEAWKVTATPETEDAVRAAAETRSLNEHPDRQEIRFLNFVGQDGEKIIVSHTRGDDAMQAEVYEEGDGRMFEALGSFLHALNVTVSYVDEGGQGR